MHKGKYAKTANILTKVFLSNILIIWKTNLAAYTSVRFKLLPLG